MPLYNGVLLIRTLFLVPFARYSVSNISVSDLELSGSPKVKYFAIFQKPICDFIMAFCWFCWYELSFLNRWRDIPHLRFRLVTLTFQGHQRSNISPFLGKPVLDFTITFCWYELSISYRLRDIPHLRFRLVTLTFQGHRKSNTFHLFFEADIATLSWPFVDTNSLFGKPICDFIMTFCWYELSISYRSRDFVLWPGPFWVTEGHIFQLFWEADMGLHNDLPLIWTLFLVPFTRYSSSKISVSDLDLSGSPKGLIFQLYWEGRSWNFIMTFRWYELSISYRLRDIPHLRFRSVTLTFQGHRKWNISIFFLKADMRLYRGPFVDTNSFSGKPICEIFNFQWPSVDHELSISWKHVRSLVISFCRFTGQTYRRSDESSWWFQLFCYWN